MVRNDTKEFNILFPSAGRRVELLAAFRDAYHHLNLKGRIVATDIDPLAPALQVADATYIVPRIRSDDYIPALIDICNRERINLIFPVLDPDVSVLAQFRDKLEETGARVAVVGAKAAEIVADKWLTSQFFRSIGLSTAKAWLPGKVGPTSIQYPVFIKPRDGSASKFTFKISNAKELKFFSDYVPNPIIEEYLPGPEITTDIVCDLHSELLGAVSRRRIEVRGGEVYKGVTLCDPAILNSCEKIVAALPAVGPITVQCIMKDGVAHYTEINARMGGGFPLGIAAGVNGPMWLLGREAAIPIVIPRYGSYRCGLYITRYDQSFYLNEDDRAKIASRHL